MNRLPSSSIGRLTSPRGSNRRAGFFRAMMPPLASEPNFSIRLAGDAAVRDIGKVTEIGEAFPGSIVASVHAEEEQARNRLALAYANALGDICEFEVDSDIVQCNRANHANASARQRLARVGRS